MVRQCSKTRSRRVRVEQRTAGSIGADASSPPRSIQRARWFTHSAPAPTLSFTVAPRQGGGPERPAAWYDAKGRLLGTGAFRYTDEHAGHGEEDHDR